VNPWKQLQQASNDEASFVVITALNQLLAIQSIAPYINDIKKFVSCTVLEAIARSPAILSYSQQTVVTSRVNWWTRFNKAFYNNPVKAHYINAKYSNPWIYSSTQQVLFLYNCYSSWQLLAILNFSLMNAYITSCITLLGRNLIRVSADLFLPP